MSKSNRNFTPGRAPLPRDFSKSVITRKNETVPPAFPGGATFFGGVFKNQPHVPGTSYSWKSEFSQWATCQFNAARKEGADLFPVEGTRQHQLQTLVDAFALNLPVNLGDSGVHPLWLEYLTENPKRLDWWRRFELLNGSCEVL